MSENVHRARCSAKRRLWAEQLLHTFKHAGYDAAREKLLARRDAHKRSPKNRAAADRLLNDVSERREMIRYPEFRAAGWKIGSGPAESQCKLIVGRLKGRSRRWDRPNAEAIAALDSLERSNQWQLHYPTPKTHRRLAIARMFGQTLYRSMRCEA